MTPRPIRLRGQRVCVICDLSLSLLFPLSLSLSLSRPRRGLENNSRREVDSETGKLAPFLGGEERRRKSVNRREQFNPGHFEAARIASWREREDGREEE